MARAGMALRRGGNHGNTENIDDVQRSIELLDRVLSEFDDVENANQVQNIQQISTSVSTPQLREKTTTTTATKSGTETTPDDESPSLGHQSEDDGYMSMNGRKAKFNLAFKPLAEIPVHQNNEEIVRVGDPDDFPPPPEEAQRLIATLLPKVSPSHKPKPRNFPLTQLPPQRLVLETIPPPHNFSNDYPSLNGLPEPPIHTATQTTLPKTRHQRPYGWESGTDFTLYPPPPPPGYRFGSLPYYQHTSAYPITSPTRVPPRTVPTVVERHREVKRHGSEENLIASDLDDLRRPLSELADDERFSDDSLEEMLPPPPPPVNKRASIAWEVPLDDNEELLTPGSTKVIGRRRRKSGSQSSTSSIPNRLKELDDWPEPPPHDDDIQSPFSDSDDLQLPANLSGTSTYVIRRGRKDRKSIITSNSSINSRLSADSRLNTPNSRFSIDLTPQHPHLNSPKSRFSLDLNRTNQDLLLSSSDLQSSRSSTPSKKHSSTFDNIKSLIVESPTIEATISPIQRVVSLPDVPATTRSRELDVTVEEEEDGEVSSSSKSAEISPLRQIEQNISELLERRDLEMQDERLLLNGMAASLNKKKKIRELQKSTSHNEIQKSEEYYRQLLLEGGTPFPKRNGIQKSESAKEMLIARDSRSIIATSNSVVDFPPLPPSPVEEDEDEYSEIGDEKSAPAVPPHHQQNSLKTRSMDVNCGRNRRHNYFNRNNVPPERRTLPTDDTKQQKRTHRYQKRSSSQDIGEIHNMQTSCSLPETPIFARGCDIPRTPHRRAPDVPGGVQTAPRQSNTVGSLNTLASSSSAATTSGYRRGTGGSFEQAYVGAELLRLAGGPGRGWYPKQRHRRPASIEHLDRMMATSGAHNPWEPSRKPLTLPPNLTPKFFQRSPRDALRRVTSLLIRKGNNGKDVRKEKELVSPTIHENTNGEETQKKKGFFKNLWKRSRHYSLEQQ